MSLDPSRVRRYATVVLFLLIVPPFIKYTAVQTWDYVGGDFEIFYRAATEIGEGRNPYPRSVLDHSPSEAVGRAWGNYIYPPLFARLLQPFLFLPPEWAKKGYLGVCLVLYLFLLWPTRKRGYDTWATWALALALILGWGPTIHTFRHGQSDFIPLFLILLALTFLMDANGDFRESVSPNRERWVGLLIGAASMVKITPLLLAPVLFFTLRWRMLRGFIVGAGLALLAAGPVLSWQYFTQVLPTMRDFTGMRHCPSLHIVLVRFFDQVLPGEHGPDQYQQTAEILGVGVTGLLFLAVLYYFWRNRTYYSRGELVIAACYLPPLFAGEVEHHYILALLPVLEATRRLMLAADLPAPFGPSPSPAVSEASWGDEKPSKAWDSRSVRRRLGAILLALSPNFYYWAFPKIIFELASPVAFQTLMVIGNSIAFVLILPVLQSGREAPKGLTGGLKEYGGEQEAHFPEIRDRLEVTVPPQVRLQEDPPHSR